MDRWADAPIRFADQKGLELAARWNGQGCSKAAVQQRLRNRQNVATLGHSALIPVSALAMLAFRTRLRGTDAPPTIKSLVHTVTSGAGDFVYQGIGHCGGRAGCLSNYRHFGPSSGQRHPATDSGSLPQAAEIGSNSWDRMERETILWAFARATVRSRYSPAKESRSSMRKMMGLNGVSFRHGSGTWGLPISLEWSISRRLSNT